MDLEEVIKKQIKLKLFISILIVAVILSGYFIQNNLITGKVTIETRTEGTCTYSGTTYDGSFLEILSPQNNSYIGRNFNFTAKTNYYGQDIITQCEGYEPQNCTLALTYLLISEDGKIIPPISLLLPKTDEGNKTYTSNAAALDSNYTEGNYSIKTTVKYSCEATELERDDRRVIVDIGEPEIIEIYPTNNLVINISSNATINVTYKLIATDTIGILNRTVSDGSTTISLIQNPNYSQTLSPGTYQINFTATDLAENTKIVSATFTIVNSSSIETPINEPDVNKTIDANIYYDTTTTPDEKVTNSSLVHIKLITNSSENSTINLKIFDSTGRTLYQNSTEQKTLETNHVFVSDGIYFYNATLVIGNEIKETPTRKIIIDTEAPMINLISPSELNTNFKSYAIIEFNTEDKNTISRKWINDGTRDIEYAGKINKSLAEGEYTWTIYVQDEAGNVAKKTIVFTIIAEKSNKGKMILIITLTIIIILLIILLIIYLLRKKQGENSPPQTQQFKPVTPLTPPTQINIQRQPMQMQQPIIQQRPVQPFNPQPIQNSAMFKNNQPVQ